LTDQFSRLKVNSPGQYEFTLTSESDDGYITITDEANQVIDEGHSLLVSSIPESGAYRMHRASDESCGTADGCWELTGVYAPSVELFEDRFEE